MSTPTYRIESDSMGELKVPAEALYGAQTQRAIDNFPISGRPLPPSFIQALAHIKQACAQANATLGLLSSHKSLAIIEATQKLIAGEHLDQFPIDIFQTGSGTSTNMNINEVIASLAKQAGIAVHPNDDVNKSQSSNDVIPSTIHVAAAIAIQRQLLPAMQHMIDTLEQKKAEVGTLVKTGRTHLMDAMPVTLGQTLSSWQQQIQDNKDRLQDSSKRLHKLPIGGTAVGTGINAPPEFGKIVCQQLAQATDISFAPMPNVFVGISTQDTAVEISGQLNVLATSLMKIANDLRWMNSGPLAGLGEIQLPALQPGSSIMPGKVNPVIPEVAAMVAAQIIGNHTAITLGGQAGNFELNVMLPMIADNLLQSIEIASNALIQLADKAIAGFIVNEDNLKKALEINPILVTALNPILGYEKGAAIAKTAYQTGRPVLEVALEMTDLDEATLKTLLNPKLLTTNTTMTPNS